MTYNFDEPAQRRGTDCFKYDAMRMARGRDDLIPLWIADMDFKLPASILDPLHDMVDRAAFGYTFPSDRYFAAVQGWFANRFEWETKKRWIVRTPGVVFAVALALQAYTRPGDAVLIQQPVYYPFAKLIARNGRALVNNELVYEHGTYRIDFADFERQIVEREVKLFILCSPHNPVGRVWTEGELARMGEICRAHDVLVVADEIHADFVYSGHTHRVFASVDEDFARHCLVCTAPSKTFNLAGLQGSNIFIPDSDLRKSYVDALGRLGDLSVNMMAMAATTAAYETGGPWVDELVNYLAGNVDAVRAGLARVPGVDLVEPEGTYLMWLDCAGLAERLGDTPLDAFMVNDARLWMNAGTKFGGARGENFERMNIATQRATVEKALGQLATAVARGA